jgi:hypothetical protein
MTLFGSVVQIECGNIWECYVEYSQSHMTLVFIFMDVNIVMLVLVSFQVVVSIEISTYLIQA